MKSDLILTEVRQHILWITLNRPDKKNALTQDMYRALTSALQMAEQDQTIAAVVITGAGDSFTAGNDLHDFLAVEQLDDSAPPFQFLYTLSQLTVPVIAGVNGLAIGIGTTILLHCDLVYASSDAQFALPFINLGLVPEAGSSLLLPQRAGYLNAAEMLLLGDAFTADQAHAYGVVNQVVAPAALMDTLMTVTAVLAHKPRGSLRATKQLLKLPVESVPDRIGREAKIFAKALTSDAARTAIRAVLERKK